MKDPRSVDRVWPDDCGNLRDPDYPNITESDIDKFLDNEDNQELVWDLYMCGEPDLLAQYMMGIALGSDPRYTIKKELRDWVKRYLEDMA